MKQKKPWLLALFVSMLCVCFLSVPAFAGDGDEDPWDADDGNGGTNGGDLGNGDERPAFGYLKESGTTNLPGSGIFSNLFFSISIELHDYFYGNSTTTQSASKDAKERSSRVDRRFDVGRSAE